MSIFLLLILWSNPLLHGVLLESRRQGGMNIVCLREYWGTLCVAADMFSSHVEPRQELAIFLPLIRPASRNLAPQIFAKWVLCCNISSHRETHVWWLHFFFGGEGGAQTQVVVTLGKTIMKTSYSLSKWWINSENDFRFIFFTCMIDFWKGGKHGGSVSTVGGGSSSAVGGVFRSPSPSPSGRRTGRSGSFSCNLFRRHQNRRVVGGREGQGGLAEFLDYEGENFDDYYRKHGQMRNQAIPHV